MGSETYHESLEKLAPETLDLHRALRSLAEELDAVDWYQQRIDATPDRELRAILTHNRDEEKEHASMLLEWIRRRDLGFRQALSTYLFSQGDITSLEEKQEPCSCECSSERPTLAKNGSTVGSLIPK